MIKLVLLDVDGTITDRNRLVSTRTIESIRDTQKKGVTVSLASGNVIPVMYGLKIFIGLNGPVFGENGGVMYQEEVETFFSMDKPMKLFRSLEADGIVHGITSNMWRQSSVAYVPESGKEEAVSAMAEEEGLDTVDSGFSWHLLNRGQNKGFALEHLKKMYSLDYDEILVMGDSFNDISMFKDQVVKAVPSDGEKRLRDIADYVTTSGKGNGAAEVLSSLSRF